MNKVVMMPTALNSLAQVLVMEPRSFAESSQAIQALRERNAVVLNLTMMDPKQAQRAVDLLAGATYSIQGHLERIAERIFLLTPSSIQISRSLEEK